MKRVLKIVLCFALIFSLLPLDNLKAEAAGADSEIIWLDKSYGEVKYFNEGLFAVESNKKWGMIDQNGKEVVSPTFDDLGYYNDGGFQEGLAAARKGMKWGYIDKTGKFVVDPKYDKVLPFSEGLAGVRIGGTEEGRWGFVDKTGKEVIPVKYEPFIATLQPLMLYNFVKGKALIYEENGLFFIDKTGKRAIAQKFYWVDDFFQDVAYIEFQKNSEHVKAYINRDGVQVPEPKVYISESRNYQFEGMAKFKSDNNKFGFKDSEGKEVIAPKYEFAREFSEGLASISIYSKEGYKWGFIDKTGKEVVMPKYSSVYDFSEGLAAVATGSYGNYKWGFIDKTGKEIIEPKYDDFYNYYPSFKDGFVVVKSGEKFGIIKNPLLHSNAKQNSAQSSDSANRVQTNQSKSNPKANGILAKYSSVKLSIDGVEAKGMEIYNIGDSNYFKLRDVAKLLESTDKKFSVDWNNDKKLISLKSSDNYKSQGNELTGGDKLDKEATVSTAKLEFNGKEVNLKAYSISGNNYFKLRDLCEMLGVEVGWNQSTSTILLKTGVDN